MKELSAKRLRFVQEYSKHPNGAAAARAAGYSKKTADRIASRLLKEPEVQAALKELQEAYAKQAGLDAVEILREIRRVALSDIGSLFDKDGQPKQLKDLTPDQRRAISAIEVELVAGEEKTTDDGVTIPARSVAKVAKVKLWDKLKALELGAKHLKLLTDKVDLSNEDGTLSVTINMGAA